jgi:hypothetical protein
VPLQSSIFEYLASHAALHRRAKELSFLHVFLLAVYVSEYRSCRALWPCQLILTSRPVFEPPADWRLEHLQNADS